MLNLPYENNYCLLHTSSSTSVYRMMGLYNATKILPVTLNCL